MVKRKRKKKLKRKAEKVIEHAFTRKLKSSGRKSPPPSKHVLDNDDHASPPPSKLVLEDDDHAAGLTGILVALVATIFNML